MKKSTPPLTVIGFDFGTKKIGVAVGQTITHSAQALCTINTRHTPPWQKIEALLQEWEPDAFVVGLPIDMYEKETDMTQAARAFAESLKNRFKRPVHFIDEKLSTKMAMYEQRDNSQRQLDIDAIAAKIILETWLLNTC